MPVILWDKVCKNSLKCNEKVGTGLLFQRCSSWNMLINTTLHSLQENTEMGISLLVTSGEHLHFFFLFFIFSLSFLKLYLSWPISFFLLLPFDYLPKTAGVSTQLVGAYLQARFSAAQLHNSRASPFSLNCSLTKKC